VVRSLTPAALSVLVCSCSSGEASRTASTLPSSTAGAPSASALAGTATATLSSAQPPTDPGPRVANGAVGIHLVNRSGKPRYLGYGRSWTERLTIERRVGAEWVAIPYQQGICAELCPADGTPPTCSFCSPPMPVPEAMVLGSHDFAWDGKEYPFVQRAGEKCGCARPTNASPGTYRVTICFLSKLDCEPSPCRPDPYGIMRRGVRLGGQPTCVSTELELGPKPTEVTLDVGVKGD
jgi:hypothetical protein